MSKEGKRKAGAQYSEEEINLIIELQAKEKDGKPITFLEIAKEFNSRSIKRKTNADVVRSIIIRLAEEGKIEVRDRNRNAPSLNIEEIDLLKDLYIKKDEDGYPITWKKIADEFNKRFSKRDLDEVNATYHAEKLIKAGELEKIDRSVNRNKRKAEKEEPGQE